MKQALKYLRREELDPALFESGWSLVGFNGAILGWVKNTPSDQQLLSDGVSPEKVVITFLTGSSRLNWIGNTICTSRLFHPAYPAASRAWHSPPAALLHQVVWLPFDYLSLGHMPFSVRTNCTITRPNTPSFWQTPDTQPVRRGA